MAAPICATSFAEPSRSRRAISEAWRLAGTAADGDGITATARSATPFAFGFQDCLRHFLDKQWYAVGALHDVLFDTGGQRLVAGDTVDHGGDFALPEPVDGKCCDMRLPNPRWPKLGSVGNDEQDAKRSDLLNRRD